MITPLTSSIYCNSFEHHLERGLLLHYYFHPHLHSMLTTYFKTFDFSVIYGLRTWMCVHRDTRLINKSSGFTLNMIQSTSMAMMHRRCFTWNTDHDLFIFYSRIRRNHHNCPEYVCFPFFLRKMVPGTIRRISGEEFVGNDGVVLRQVSRWERSLLAPWFCV